MQSLESLSPDGMLEVCALRMMGSSLKDPLAKATGGAAGLDDEMALVKWLERIEGFDQARALIIHVYGHGHPIENYRYVQPGQTLFQASCCHSQAGLCLEGLKAPQLARKLLGDFIDNLIKAQRSKPFRVPARPAEEIDVEVIALEVEARAEFLSLRHRFKPRECSISVSIL